LAIPIFIFYDILIRSYSVFLPNFISFMTFEVALVFFGALLFFGVRRFRRSRQWGYLWIALAAWLVTGFFFLGGLSA
jgi:hypothetical protein